MKTILISLFVLLGVGTMYSQVNYTLSITPESILTTQKDGYTVVDLDEFDGYTNETGKPQIPYFVKRFVIPRNMQVSDIETTQISQLKINGNFLVYPSQPPILVGAQDDSTPYTFVTPDSSAYNSDKNYPSGLYSLESDEDYYGHRIVTLKMYPVSYNAAKKELFINSFDLTIHYESNESYEENQGVQSGMRARKEQNFILSIIENKEDLYRFYEPHSMNRVQTMATTNHIYIDPESPVIDYVVITCDSLKSSFTELIEWKRKKGYMQQLKLLKKFHKASKEMICQAKSGIICNRHTTSGDLPYISY